MIEVEVKVTLQVDPNEPKSVRVTEATMREAAREAVGNAVRFAHDNGFQSELADVVSIGVAGVDLITPTWKPRFAREIVNEKAGPQGWNDHSIVHLLCELVDTIGMGQRLEDFLLKQAESENDESDACSSAG